MWIIGSQAAVLNGLRFRRLINKNEYDIIGTREEFDNLVSRMVDPIVQESSKFPGKFNIRVAGLLLEFDATENASNQILDELYEPSMLVNKFGVDFKVAPKEVLYEIKRSHANFDVDFEKSLHDVTMMRHEGWHLDAWYGLFYQTRKAEAKARYGQRQERIKLNKSNDDFFKAGMKLRTYEHDDLHKAVAFFPDYPMFIRCKRDPDSAKIERDLFEQLDHKFQIYMAQEESSVLFLERDYIPQFFAQNEVPTEQEAASLYRKAVIKVMRDLCKGWFQDFMIDNAAEIMTSPPWNSIERFNTALNAGKLKEVQHEPK